MSFVQKTAEPLSRRARMAANLAIATLLFILISHPFLSLAAGILA
jgi:hypothetical protein